MYFVNNTKIITVISSYTHILTIINHNIPDLQEGKQDGMLELQGNQPPERHR